MARILVIDDDAGVRESMARMLRSAGYTVLVAASGEEGFDLARGDAFDVILSDMRMPGLSGLDILKKLRDVNVDACFIVMTGFGTVDTAVEAMKLGAVDFVQKPFFRDELLMRVPPPIAGNSRGRSRCCSASFRHRRRPKGPSGAATDGEGQGSHPPRAAAPGTVLITGETGTERAAARYSRGQSQGVEAFVALNCAALTESLLENELFGHTRGAFTGAAAPGPGRSSTHPAALSSSTRSDDDGAPGQAAACGRIGRGPPDRRERSRRWTCVSSPRRTSISRRL
jgi:DNA-binding NtrC family response regulator